MEIKAWAFKEWWEEIFSRSNTVFFPDMTEDKDVFRRTRVKITIKKNEVIIRTVKK